ncbi:MAG: M1 family metallopeptidase [Solirubrobacteraceae bacterium]|nr:M1 family metallopeptidase [Solirubrobacteraceae bacterium]
MVRSLSMPKPKPIGALVASMASLALLAPAALGAAAPSPGGTSIGDPLFPTLGNTGYDAQHYDLDLAFGAAPTDPVTGNVTLLATATRSLSSFSLDYAGPVAGVVFVNGRPADYTLTGEKIVITPGRPLLKGLPFVVALKGFVSSPRAFNADDPTSVAFIAGPSGTAMLGQTAYAHHAWPSNDHPSDKASFSFQLSAPDGETAVANGLLAGKRSRGGRTTWSYVQRQPMATELTQVAVGDYDVIDRGRYRGVQIRDVTVRSATATLRPQLEVEKAQLDWLTDRLGPYPFDVYGSLVSDQNVGFALETQTLSYFSTNQFAATRPEGRWKPVMLHELAHQWLGNSVAPKEWADIWNSEGHATLYENLWAAENGYLPDSAGFDTFDELIRSIYADGDRARAELGPVGRPKSGSDADIFSSQSYDGGMLVLYALRQEMGTEAFERLERRWPTKYRGRSAGTREYIALASEVAGRDLRPFLESWLYGTATPPMPGHPDWTIEPVA